MRKLTLQRGFTLLETLLSAAIFVMLMASVSYGIIVGLRAQEFDRNVREAQLATRNAINRLSDEMRSATILPVTGLGKSLLPSGVLYPDSYGQYADGNTPFSGQSPRIGAAYPTGKEQGADGRNYYYAQNRVIFIRPKTESTTGKFQASQMSEYVYVEWMVPAAAPNRLYRKTHSITGVVDADRGHKLTNNKWLVVPSFFTDGSHLTTNTNDESQWIVAKLPNADDIFQLRVSHAPYTNPGSYEGVTNIEQPYGTSYERNLFNVKMTATVFRRGTNAQTAENLKQKSVIRLTSQVRIQSGT